MDLAVKNQRVARSSTTFTHIFGSFCNCVFLCKVRGQMGSYPIKLFYTSNIPIILQATLRRDTIV